MKIKTRIKKIPTPDGRLKLLILSPTKAKKPAKETPGILWIHGGGYVTGMAGMIYMSRALRLVKRYGAVVVTPAYRLAPKHVYPAALEDCYAALKYVKEQADELKINPSQLMVGGESAGGGLTAAVCMLARDRDEVSIAYQMPLYPMLDDRDTETSRDNHAPVWNTRRNHFGWRAYLGRLWQKDVPAYAAPARQTDHRGLPPAYTFVGDIEPFYAETMTYVENLRQAGVEAEVDVYPGCFHAFDMLLPLKKESRAAVKRFEERYLYAVENYFAEQGE